LNNINVAGFRKLAFLAPKCLISRPEKNGVIVLPNGLRLWIDPVNDNGVERSIYYSGSYESGTIDFIKKHLKKGDCFVDVGANIGLMSIEASESVGSQGKIYSFEPHPDTAKILRFNIDLNSFENIEVIEKGVGSKSGEAKIYDRWDVNRGGASVFSANNNQEGFAIQLVVLDEVFQKIDIQLIKIDIEGYELEALKGAKRILSSENPPILIVECTEETENQNYTRVELYRWLKNTNSQYKFYKLKGTKVRKSKLVEVSNQYELPTHDNLFCIPR
jgi:FkbM family methyltransferase